MFHTRKRAHARCAPELSSPAGSDTIVVRPTECGSVGSNSSAVERAASLDDVWWVVDGNNIMGAGADGWWNDRPAAATRLAQAVADWARGHDDPVTLVFDGLPQVAVAERGGRNLVVDFARRAGRDGADDRIVELVEGGYDDIPEITVVTSDKGLIARLPPGVSFVGAGAFRARLGLPAPGGRRRRG